MVLVRDYDPVTGQPTYREQIDRPKAAYTTTQRNALSGVQLWTGRIIYNSTTAGLEFYDGTAWQPLTPVWTDVAAAAITFTQGATVTKTATYAAYEKIGTLVHWQGRLAVTGAGTAATAIKVSVPFAIRTAAAVANRPIGTGVVLDLDAVLFYRCIAVIFDANTLVFFVNGSTVANYAGADTFTAALASGDTVSWDVTYESAA